MHSENALKIFELPHALVKPALEACRMFNTSLDALFYDVPTLAQALRNHGEAIATSNEGDAPIKEGTLDLSAITNPEGSLLLIDPTTAPYIKAWDDVTAFIESQKTMAKPVKVATITGVGSSALGSAALSWNVAIGLKQPALAIVPGYGVADVVLQGLGGWYGFGVYDFFNTKSQLQNFLATFAPKTATLGRSLSASAPGARTLNGSPVFRTGCGSSDVLHDLMEALPSIQYVVGHSKGALSISNALHALPRQRTAGIRIVTLGCPIAEDLPSAHYHQFLGLFDALGALNAWGHMPDAWVPTGHSTNPSLPLSMDAEDLVET
jgi:hypothetical protein